MFAHKEDDALVGQRALKFLDWLMQHPEQRIAVVSHRCVLRPYGSATSELHAC